MDGTDNNIEILIFKYLQQTLTVEDVRRLDNWISESQSNRMLFEKLTNQQYINQELGKIYEYDAEKGWAAVKSRLPVSKEAVASYGNKGRTLPGIFLLRGVSVAAMLLLVVCSTYLFVKDKAGGIKNTVVSKAASNRVNILPGQRKATLILGDGSAITLDGKINGALAEQGNTNISKLGGKLTYKNTGSSVSKTLYNTILNPRGAKQYEIVLADGSAVWLNAESSIRFPTVFTGAERRVEITGEAYFEVAANKMNPFIVSVRGTEIRVSGTHFNVMAYQDEAHLTTTLLEGSVTFSNGHQSVGLKPGQQSRMNNAGVVEIAKKVNVGEVIAWKNEAFYFERADIETVMRQVSRYYDVEVVFRNGTPKDLLHADIPRNTSLGEVLKALEIAGGIHCTVEGKEIIVI